MTTLSLVTPQGSNFIKDFPEQNAVNMDAIDAFAGPCLTTHGLQTFSPGLSGSLGVNPVLGTGGFSRAFYYQVFNRIYMWGEFRFGTAGINAGGDIYLLSLPFNVDSVIGANSGTLPIVGVGSVFDANSNAGRLPLTVHLRSPTSIQFNVRMNSGLSNRELRSSGYIVWDFNDGVSWSARFQRIP